MAGVVELYSDADLARMKRQISRRSAAHAAIAAVALAVCVALILLTRTGNAARMELTVIAVSTIAGWVVLYGTIFRVVARRRELRHAAMLRGEERQAVSGTVVVTDERVAIHRSIVARRVEVRGEGDPQRLLVCEERAAALAEARPSTVYTVHGYVAAYEVSP